MLRPIAGLLAVILLLLAIWYLWEKNHPVKADPEPTPTPVVYCVPTFTPTAAVTTESTGTGIKAVVPVR